MQKENSPCASKFKRPTCQGPPSSYISLHVLPHRHRKGLDEAHRKAHQSYGRGRFKETYCFVLKKAVLELLALMLTSI